MHSPPVAKTTNADSSARMLTSTVATLGCAFVLVIVAAVTAMLAITHEANRTEAVRQRDRVEAAIESQVRLRRLRLENFAAAGALQLVLNPGVPANALQWAFTKLSNRFLEFDGAYLVTATGQVLAGVEGGKPAGQPGYEGLRHFSHAIPGAEKPQGGATGTEIAGAKRDAMSLKLVDDGHATVALMIAELTALPGLEETQPARRVFMVGYRSVTAPMLAELAVRYRVPDVRVVRDMPADPLLRREIFAPDQSVKAWLSWTPERPGDAMIQQFAWALVGVGIIFAAIFVYVIQRLRGAASEIGLRERQIQRLAAHDELSLLPNRRTFDLRLDQELAQLGRTKTGIAVLLLDLDRFKAVNDTYGHTAGDELIRQVADRLAGMMRAGDTVARLGGDEFGIIQTNLQDAAGCAALGERILEALTRPFDLMGIDTIIGCSIGIALAPQDGSDRETLLKLADTALYQSKNEGRNRYSFFEARMNRSLQLKRLVEDDLRKAIANDELLLHFQPQVSVDGSTITGVEALVRWPHPVHGMVPPSEFIGIAEERGLIVPLSEWVLRRACLEAKRWDRLKLAVNISPVQFRHKDFVRNVIRIIEETGFDPARLELELTEGVVVEDADAAETALMDLRAHGIGLALDDFGIGYSSLIYLRRFAFDKIKIDRSFLEYMETTGESAILVHSVVHLGRALGLRVCAEGVETTEQHRFLQAIGCHELQGFLFSKAVSPDEIDRLLTLDAPFADSLAAA
ncbi:putative bifunctional diguanylate cyclase/phosphodiesterase [Bosea sp. (in: a-proteobacteria)]|uniref:putative bifunctional diguanylate cyclase/phosphodiesterase n=1 Tax=Bosea sp. (in: a-proteobacteria) TaxID=1871050 RepID=UPI003F7125B7